MKPETWDAKKEASFSESTGSFFSDTAARIQTPARAEPLKQGQPLACNINWTLKLLKCDKTYMHETRWVDIASTDRRRCLPIWVKKARRPFFLCLVWRKLRAFYCNMDALLTVIVKIQNQWCQVSTCAVCARIGGNRIWNKNCEQQFTCLASANKRMRNLANRIYSLEIPKREGRQIFCGALNYKQGLGLHLYHFQIEVLKAVGPQRGSYNGTIRKLV